MNSEFAILALIGLSVLLGLYAGKLSRRLGMPSLIGYLILGTVMGVSILGLFKSESLGSLSFITQIVLGFVAFSIGSEMNLRNLIKSGWSMVIIVLSESILSLILVTLAVYLITGDLPLALIFGAMAPATAPAGTVAVISEYKAKGPLTSTLLTVAGMDDGVAILLFGVAGTLSKQLLLAETAAGTAAFNFLEGITTPLIEISLSLVIGCLLGFVLSFLLKKLSNNNEIPALVFAFIALGCGLAIQYHLSLILLNMGAGFVLANTCSTSSLSSVAGKLRPLMPLLFILFFFLAGAHLDIGLLPSMGFVGAAYLISRSLGKIAGARIGAVLGKAPSVIRDNLGIGLLSQAGVAIGLSMIVMQDFGRIGSAHANFIASSIVTTVTATCIVFEIVGPILTKQALRRAGEIPD